MQSVALYVADGTAALTVRPDATETLLDLRKLPAEACTAAATTESGQCKPTSRRAIGTPFFYAGSRCCYPLSA